MVQRKKVKTCRGYCVGITEMTAGLGLTDKEVKPGGVR